jgi:hypothetical protein
MGGSTIENLSPHYYIYKKLNLKDYKQINFENKQTISP